MLDTEDVFRRTSRQLRPASPAKAEQKAQKFRSWQEARSSALPAQWPAGIAV